ncbi:hypothetical protein JOB18_030479 [Solea senegalensis]|uniref:CRAL-TRIO domain-containing protein n=1 Tax=Solea senegalensis TaxID=28829 RepID=A0AAV6RU00_SOLSE|nr:hypothetical protein JOB18_030479 [Solea senegalensis]
MSRHTTGEQSSGQRSATSSPLPPDHVLNSGAVLLPGAFDQHGCPLIVFPTDTHAKLYSQVSTAHVVDFISYFLSLHNKQQEKQSLASVVADLSLSSLPTIKFIAETLLLLELPMRTIHSVYIIQPKKKDVAKLLLKLLSPASFKKVFLKEISALSNHIDRSQLTPSLGGYFIYCHHSWVTFVKEIDVFVQEFLSVVQRLPTCISSLQALSRLPLPTTLAELQHFCSTNEAKFQQLRRELGLDELLSHCENVLEKLRHPERQPCYQAMAGTALFFHTAFDMLHNHRRITTAVEKVELLWHQAFSQARLQLQLIQLRGEALQITQHIETLEKKLQTYNMDIAKDAAQAEVMLSHFETSIHTPAMAHVGCAEDVIHTLTRILPSDRQSSELWVLDLERLKEKVRSAVNLVLQTLRAVSNYHHYFNKANNWYSLVLSEDFLQELLSGVSAAQCYKRNFASVPAWRHRLSTFLKRNPPPDMEELLHLAHLSKVIPDDEVQWAGQRMSERCMTLRKLLMSSGSVVVASLQQALHWQYEFLRSSSHVHRSPDDRAAHRAAKDVQNSRSECGHVIGQSSSPAVIGTVSTKHKPSSLTSFDSGFVGAANGQVEVWGGPGLKAPSVLAGNMDSVRPAKSMSGVSDHEDYTSIQITPKDSLHFEIQVKRSAALPTNPWLSLPVDDLEKSYTVTITQKTELHSRSDPYCSSPHTAVFSSSQPEHCLLYSQSTLEDSQFSPIHNVLSSTITDGSSTDGIPTLLWDSYDLHEQNHDAGMSLVDFSEEDWDEKEHEGLREVEKILDRADQILEEEESVAAQEVELEALLRSENTQGLWPQLLTVMSSTELTEAGVLGLDDSVEPAEVSGSAGDISGTQASEDDGHFDSRPDLLTELRTVHLLEKLIMEENLKIHELRCYKETPNNEVLNSKPANGSSGVSRDREAFLLQVEKEKREVEQLERSLHRDRPLKVVKCSVMKTGGEFNEDQSLYDELSSQRTPSVSVSQHNSEPASSDSAPCGCEGTDVKLSAQESGKQLGESTSKREWRESAHEAAVSPDMRRDDGAFDPGGESLLPPVPASPAANNNLTQQDINHSTEVLDPGPSAVARRPDFMQPDLQEEPFQSQLDSCHNDSHMFLYPKVTAHSNNNNNNKHSEESEITAKDEGDASEVSTCLHEAEEIHTFSVEMSQQPAAAASAAASAAAARLPPHQLNENGPDDFWRISRCGSPGNIHMRKISDCKTPIVLDTGSGMMKAGFADQEQPNILFPTVIGTPKYEEVMNGHFERESYIGHEAQHMRGVLALKHPIKNGIIRDWDDMEKIWDHSFQLLCVDPQDHPVLLTEAAMNPVENRQRMVEIMFEFFTVPFTYVAMQAVLALYASGRSTGVVFDSGDGVSHSVPVFDGYCLPHAVQRLPVAGVDVTMELRKLLQEQGLSMCTTAELEIVREMKEKCCCVALDYEAALTQDSASCREMPYTLPDGRIVTLCTERFRAPEILFKPQMIGHDHYGIHESIFKSILSSDIDLRRCLLGNIILSGGNTLLLGLPERLQAELRDLTPADTGHSVHVSSPKDRDFSVWCGGAVLANLPTFSSAWISQEEYEEFGPQIVFRKCF